MGRTNSDNIETAWEIDPAVVARLWPVIDVYGRISAALRARANTGELPDGHRSERSDGPRIEKGSAA